MIPATLFIGALLVEGAFFAAWLLAERKERKELLDRLMARSLTEYTISQTRQNTPPAGGERRHNVIANHQARQRGEAPAKPARPANPLLSQTDD